MLIIKVGGGKDINWSYVLKDFAQLKEKAILVHGANYKMKEVTEAMGKEVKMLTSPSGYTSRYSDKETMDIFLMSYCGVVNKRIVEELQKLGVNAVGLSGVDGRLWEGRRKKVILAIENGKTKAIRDNFHGKVEKVNVKLVKLLLENGYTPVITAPAISDEGEIINIDNDRAVAIMARDLGVKKLVSLFEAPGLLKDPKDEKSLVKKVDRENIDEMLEYAEGRMKKKVLGAQEAIENGVKEIYWGDGRGERPITRALGGKGTVIS